MTTTKPLKIVLVGDPNTGKTKLWSRLAKNHFNPKYEPTTGMNIDSHTLFVGDQTVEIDIFDLAGLKKWRLLADGIFRDADGVLLMYDMSNPATFENLAAWLRLIREAASKTFIKLIGNKNDLQRMVSRKEAEQFATGNGLSYIETSALNGSNVHLAFEIMAQEINVATHSLSEPSTDSFVQKDPKSTSDDDDQQEKPFQVVLIDIEQAAYGKNIVCVEMPLEEADLEFISISYRWGEVQEQVIDTNLGYMASVTSFHLNDFYGLCWDMMKDPDLRSIKYVWVDAICVDQNNQARRKATIYQMSKIYHRAAYILAVPDLHFEHLRNNNTWNYDLSKHGYDFYEYIYYLLHGKCDPVVQLTEKWFDKMGIPKAEMARKNLTRPYNARFANFLKVYSLQDDCCPDSCQHNCNDDAPSAMLDNIQDSINCCHDHPESSTMVYENSDCALCSLQMDTCKNKSDSDQKWLQCVLRELQYDKYRNSVAKKSEEVDAFMEYLENLIKDWSSRVWVMSEYNIAKSKQSRKMKFWFVSIGIRLKDDEKLEFFLFDFDKTEGYHLFPKSDVPLDFNCLADISNFNYFRFYKTLMSQLNEKSFLEMVLGSKASRNEDRFHAILPSSEYKDKLTSREVVSSWQINNIVSVKLKLYELMTTKDKMKLLYMTAISGSKPNGTFPAFANINVTQWNTLPVEDHDNENRPCNFDLYDNATLRFVPPMENGFDFYKLNLSPKTYYVVDDAYGIVKEAFDDIFNSNKGLWKTLEINYFDDELVYVYIPIYTENIVPEYLHQYIQHIALFGSFKKSKWLLCKIIFKRHIGIQIPMDSFSWKYYDNSDGNTTFDIY